MMSDRRRTFALVALSILVLPLAHIQLYWTMCNIWGCSEAWKLITEPAITLASWPLALSSLASSALMLACVSPKRIWALLLFIAAVAYNVVVVVVMGELVVHGPLHVVATGILVWVAFNTLRRSRPQPL